MTTEYPRREKKKQATRAKIIESATALFSENGYDETTLESIAEAADLHLQTLYRHFESKSDLASSIDREYFRAFRTAFEERKEPTIEFWRSWIEQTCEQVVKQGERYRKTALNLFAVPTMSTTYLSTWHDYQQLLADGIARDIGASGTADQRPILIASMLWGGHLHTLRCWVLADGKTDFTKDSLRIVDTVIEQFDHITEHKTAP